MVRVRDVALSCSYNIHLLNFLCLTWSLVLFGTSSLSSSFWTDASGITTLAYVWQFQSVGPRMPPTLNWCCDSATHGHFAELLSLASPEAVVHPSVCTYQCSGLFPVSVATLLS